MTESNIAMAEGTPGKRAHTDSKSIGGVTVEDEYVIVGEPFLATYSVTAAGVSVATTAAHVLQIMAGSSLKVRLRSLSVQQLTSATTASLLSFELLRLSSAGTGGTAITPRPYDTTDSASGATAMTLPSAKGTETVTLSQEIMVMRQAILATSSQVNPKWEWHQPLNAKPIIIPAGTANGIALKIGTGVAAATVNVIAEFVEANY